MGYALRLVLIAGLLLGTAAGAAAPARPASAKAASLLIEVPELQEMRAKVRIVDLRPAEAYKEGHIPGAMNRPGTTLDSLEMNRKGLPMPLREAEAMFRELGIMENMPVVAYDDDGGRFAARFFYVAEFFGHKNVRILNGGWSAWLAAGGATELEHTALPIGTFRPRPSKDKIATAEWLSKQIEQRKNMCVLDARSPEEYRGERAGKGQRPGRVPDAVLLDWRDTTTENGKGKFKSPEELRKLLADRGVDARKDFVTYCASGIRASQLYFVLRLLGYKNVRNYDGSWEDWGTRPELPVKTGPA